MGLYGHRRGVQHPMWHSSSCSVWSFRLDSILRSRCAMARTN